MLSLLYLQSRRSIQRTLKKGGKSTSARIKETGKTIAQRKYRNRLNVNGKSIQRATKTFLTNANGDLIK
jgi:hypothetical protein